MTLDWNWMYETLGMMSAYLRKFDGSQPVDDGDFDKKMRRSLQLAAEGIRDARANLCDACVRADDIRKSQPVGDIAI